MHAILSGASADRSRKLGRANGLFRILAGMLAPLAVLAGATPAAAFAAADVAGTWECRRPGVEYRRKPPILYFAENPAGGGSAQVAVEVDGFARRVYGRSRLAAEPGGWWKVRPAQGPEFMIRLEPSIKQRTPVMRLRWGDAKRDYWCLRLPTRGKPNVSPPGGARVSPPAMPGASPPPAPLRLLPRPAQAPARAAGRASAIEQASEVVLNVRLNGVSKGDFLATATPDGDFLFNPDDLEEMGIAHPSGRTVNIAGQKRVSMKSPGVRVAFDEKTLTLDVQVSPSQLGTQKFDLGPVQPRVPVHARAPGGFLNYRLGYSGTEGESGIISTDTELGLSLGEFLLLSQQNSATSAGQTRSVRLQTSLIRDQPEELRRWVIGDSFVSSGELGSSFDMGGLGVSKLYQINPYLIKQPAAGFAGAVALPSTADVYVDGTRVRTEQLAPGQYNLQNLNYYGGLRNVDIVLRDQFGREQTISFPYFFTDQLLGAGLQEYSYDAGYIRQNFGIASNDYGDFALSAFHRYGLTDWLTIGAGGDASGKHVNLGPHLGISMGAAGVLTGSYAASRDGDTGNSGTASSGAYTYIRGAFSAQAAYRRFSENYTTVASTLTDPPQKQGSAGVSYGARDVGTYSLSYAIQTTYGGTTDQRSVTLAYSKTLFGSLTVAASVSRVTQGTTGIASFVGITYYPGTGYAASASHQRTKDGDTSNAVEFDKITPIGEGLGYRVLAQRSVTGDVATDDVAPFVQYNARNAIFTAQSNSSFTSGQHGTSYQVAMAGAVASIGNHFYLARPINDSFGLVQLNPPLEGVRVLKSGAEIGKTDASGSVFVPNLGSYQVNDVGIEPKDIPIDYSMTRSAQGLRPPFRSGSIARFELTRVRAVTGKFKFRSVSQVTPLAGYNFVLSGETQQASVSTVSGGEFYLENLAPGRYTAELNVKGTTCRVSMVVPDSEEIVSDLGDIYCEAIY